MRTLDLSQLPDKPSIAGPLYHRSGEVLVRRGQALDAAMRAQMRRAGIRELVALDPGDDPERVRLEAQGKRVALADVPDGTVVRAEVRDGRGRLLVRPRSVMSPDVRVLLAREGIEGFLVRRSPAELGLDEVELFRALGADAAAFPVEEASLPALSSARVARRQDLTEARVRSWIDAPTEGASPPLVPSDAWRIAERPAEHRAGCVRLYAQLLAETGALLSRLASVRHEPRAGVESIARRVVASLVRDRELVVNLVNQRARGEYLPSHALHTAILAAAIGIALRAPAEEVLELAVAGLLARVGMLRVPREVVEKCGRLSPEEMAEVRRAPSHALAVLRKIDRVPVRAVIAAYQVMERADASGYPRGLGKDGIHRLSRVVSVADVYDALLADRPWRAALLPYRAMEVLLLLVHEGRLDADVSRAFLDTVSLFPIGSWVALSDGRTARVVAANGPDHTRPVVVALFDRDDARLAVPERIDLSVRRELSVLRPVAGEDYAVSTVEGW